MNSESMKLFAKQACEAFPGLIELLERSPATLAVWGRTLERVTLDEASSVLGRWIDGSLAEPPVGFRRELFALDIKAIVAKDRGDTIRKRDSEEQRAKTIRKESGTPAYAFCRPFMDKVISLNNQVANGSLTQQERNFMVEELIEETVK
jgi:hypothetical protein